MQIWGKQALKEQALCHKGTIMHRHSFMSTAFYLLYRHSPNGLTRTLALSIVAESLLRKRPNIPEECSDPQSSDCKYKNQ